MRTPSSNYQSKKVLIGISSGIAAYKVIDLIQDLKIKGLDVELIMTFHASRMIDPSIFEKAIGHKVHINLFPEGFNYKRVIENKEVEHIKVADSALIFLIIPATANIISKIAGGIADDFLTTTVLASTCPVVVCPSMNVNMWENPIIQGNIDKLISRGFIVIPPDEGLLACGYTGYGRLPEKKLILREIDSLLKINSKLKGKKILVTGGGTLEPIDSVRVLSNRASGKMGAAIAEECFRAGGKVKLVRSSSSVSTRFGIMEEIFETASDLEEIIKKDIKNFDFIFHTAAVSDFVPVKVISGKIESKKNLSLDLKPIPKIIDKIKIWNPKIKLIGFKAVFMKNQKELELIGTNKLRNCKADYIVVNDIGRKGIGFGADKNEVCIVSKVGLVQRIAKTSKREIARRLIELII